MRLRGVAALSVLSCLPLDAAVTFHKDVVPILQARCQSCHRPGEAAPMSFLNYQSTRPWAKAIRQAVLQRRMPPWSAEPGIAHFKNDPTLSKQEIDTLAGWADSGAAEGNPGDAPPPRRSLASRYFSGSL